VLAAGIEAVAHRTQCLAKANRKERPAEAPLRFCFCSIANEDYKRKARSRHRNNWKPDNLEA